MKEHPVLGVGYFNFIPYYQHYYPQDMLYAHAELPHNIFIQVGTDVGFTGLFFFLMIILYCLRTTRNIAIDKDVDIVWRSIAAGWGYGVFGFLIAGQFVTVAYYPFLWISLAFIVCMRKILDKQKKIEAENSFLATSQTGLG
jgi:putative inorganic carbon (HCO3(-)) transporter